MNPPPGGARRQIKRPRAPARIAHVHLVDLPVVADGTEWLAVMEDKAVAMTIRRVFSVHLDRAGRRGMHAHRLCNQFLVCLGGRIGVTCDDGTERLDTILDGPGRGLFLPAGIWAHQDYGDSSTLLVLCDRPYDPSDYLRDYQEFLAFRARAAKRG